MFFINYLATREEKGELLQTFQDLDLNKDGMLSKEELIIGLLFFCLKFTLSKISRI